MKEIMKFINRYSILIVIVLFFVTIIKSTNEIQKSKISPYFCVFWNKKTEKWQAQLYIGGNIKKRISGGYWRSDLDAAKMVNKICEKYLLEHKNKDIGAKPMEQKEEKKSNYKCISWNPNRNKWWVCVQVGYKKDANEKKIKPNRISGKYWDSELDAAKQVNKMCDFYGLQRKNPEIGTETEQIKTRDCKLNDIFNGEIHVHTDNANIENEQPSYASNKGKQKKKEEPETKDNEFLFNEEINVHLLEECSHDENIDNKKESNNLKKRKRKEKEEPKTEEDVLSSVNDENTQTGRLIDQNYQDFFFKEHNLMSLK